MGKTSGDRGTTLQACAGEARKTIGGCSRGTKRRVSLRELKLGRGYMFLNRGFAVEGEQEAKIETEVAS